MQLLLSITGLVILTVMELVVCSHITSAHSCRGS